jgi:hypothetical protein
MPWDSSNPLYRWKKKHGKLSKRKVNKSKSVHMSAVRPMPKHRRLRRIRSYPHRRYRAFRRGKAPISLLTALPIVNSAVIQPIFGDGNQIGGALQRYNAGDMQGAIKEFADVVSINFTGYKPSDGSWWFNKVAQTYGGIILGYAGSKIADKVGANRMMRRVPLVGKYIKL